jgi:hypothetical protein
MSAREREAVSECRHAELASALLTKNADHKNRRLQCVNTNAGQGVVKSILLASRGHCEIIDPQGASCQHATTNEEGREAGLDIIVEQIVRRVGGSSAREPQGRR